jgi:hypothetical protein
MTQRPEDVDAGFPCPWPEIDETDIPTSPLIEWDGGRVFERVVF